MQLAEMLANLFGPITAPPLRRATPSRTSYKRYKRARNAARGRGPGGVDYERSFVEWYKGHPVRALAHDLQAVRTRITKSRPR